MSVAELTAVIHKEPGAACGFTLVKHSCTINKIVDQVGVDDQLKPGDYILRINDIEVDGESVREVLRGCRDLQEVHVTIARSGFQSRRFHDQARMLGITSPKSPKPGFSFCGLFSKKAPKKDTHGGRRQSSLGSYSPQAMGSATSVSSTGMRTVDLRKLQKEGAGSMWKASRDNSLRSIT
jgi:hypothetical protein